MRIGIDLGGTKTEGVLLEGEQVRERSRVPTPAGDYRGTLEVIVGLVARLERVAGGPCTVGVGTPGAWVPGHGAMRNCNSTCLNGRPLWPDLEARLERPVRMANDANCLALSELEAGAAVPEADGVVFAAVLGTGVGGGLAVGGRLISGRHGLGGEWGHNPLPAPAAEPLPGRGPTPELAALQAREASLPRRSCYCGRRDCLETWLSGPGLARTHRALGGPDLPGPAIVARGDRDPVARDALALWTDQLARGFASVVNLVDPDVIVLGGGLSAIGRVYGELPARIAAHQFDAAPRPSGWRGRIVPARHGDSSGVLGAARLWPVSGVPGAGL